LQEIKTQGLDCKTSKCQGSKRKWPLTSALFIFFTRKQEENGCLYCIKIHATAWHSLVIKTREGEPVRGGRREVKKTVVPLFLLKETEEATERDHEQWRKKAASPPSRFCFFCCQRGVNTGNQQDVRTGELGGESEPPGEREREKEANETNQKKRKRQNKRRENR